MKEWDNLNEQEQGKWIDHIRALIDYQNDSVINLWNEYDIEHPIYMWQDEDDINEFFEGQEPISILRSFKNSIHIDDLIDSYSYFAYNEENYIEAFNKLDDFSVFNNGDFDEYEYLAKFAYEEYGNEWHKKTYREIEFI